MNAENLTNPEAEWAISASLLHKPSLIAEVVGTQLEAVDFLRPDARAIYATTVEAYYADQPVEPLSIAERLRVPLAQTWNVKEAAVATELLRRVNLRDMTANVIDHAAIVQKLSTSRKLLSVIDAASASIAGGELTPEQVAATMSTDALAITSGTAKRAELFSWMQTGAEYANYLRRQKLAKEKGIELAVYTGYSFIDDYTRGIAPTELCFIAGAPGAGKALALDTPLPTPWGWTTMGEVRPGYELMGADGRPVRVLGVTDVLLGRPCYRVSFSDGSQLIADAEHQWLTSTRLMRVANAEDAVHTTTEIAATLRRSDGGYNHRVQNHPGLDLPPVELSIEPYLLGLWLGDGTARNGNITAGSQDVDELMTILPKHTARQIEKVRGETAWTLKAEGLGDDLARLALLQNKSIPDEYLRAEAIARMELLDGLVDSDGHVDTNGRLEISVCNERLADGIFELLCTLGLKPSIRGSKAMLDGRWVGWRYRIGVAPDWYVGQLQRKRRGSGPKRGFHRARFITAVSPVPSRPVRCVEVEGGLYLAGRTMIPTHNSILGWKCAEGFAARQMKKAPEHRVGTLVVSMEMGLVPSSTRLAQSISGLDGMRLREGDISQPEYERLLREWKNRDGLPIFFNYASNFRLSQLRALIVEAIRRYNVGFIVIDHFRQIDPDATIRDPNDRDEVKVRFLKESLAKDLNVAILCIAHTLKMGRASEGNPRPRLADLRGSGQIAANADFIGMLHKPKKNASEEEQLALGLQDDHAEILWEKARHTGEGTAYLSLEPATMTVRPR